MYHEYTCHRLNRISFSNAAATAIKAYVRNALVNLASSLLWWRSRFKICRRPITHKTVGIRLPRLRCGARLVWPGPTDQPNRRPLLSPPFVHGGVGRLWHRGVFESARKRAKAQQGLSKVNDDYFVYACVSKSFGSSLQPGCLWIK